MYMEVPGSYEHVAPTTSILFLCLQAATKSFAETYARRTALSMTSAIVKVVTGLLIQANPKVRKYGNFLEYSYHFFAGNETTVRTCAIRQK